MNSEKTVWAFDLGKGSIGEAVRQGNKFLHKASLLIPAEFAETKTAAGRRRMWRTRQAHKAREHWLDEVMRKAGIEVLRGRNYDKAGNWKAGEPADVRLEREFAEPGDSTCYTSCLLRIKLLRGEKLESWQIYKALHSAIQRRGYDPDIPWKTRSQRKAKPGEAEDDEAGTQARMEQFEKDLEAMAPGKPEVQFPCYFDAWKIGLWNPSKPGELKERIDCRAESTRNQIVPRRLVKKEITALVDGAAKDYPKLKGQAKYLLFGPSEKGEGVVFKRLDAPYIPGRPNSGGTQLKHKFYATLSALVMKVNKQRSVEMGLLYNEGWKSAGNVTIPPNFEVPAKGAVVEIRYLYAFKESGCLFQPTYLGPRTDLDPFDCMADQLKYKASEGEDEP